MKICSVFEGRLQNAQTRLKFKSILTRSFTKKKKLENYIQYRNKDISSLKKIAIAFLVTG